MRAALHREQVADWLLAGVDLTAASVSTYAATVSWGSHLQLTFALIPFYAVLIAKTQGLYDRDEGVLRKSTLAEWRRLLQTAVLTSLGVGITCIPSSTPASSATWCCSPQSPA